jgi:hypothetical protein
MSVAERVILLSHFDAIAAGTDEDHYVTMPHIGEWRVLDAYIAPDTTTAADGSNYTTVTVEQSGTTIASWSTLSSAEGALTAGTGAEMTFTETGASGVVGKGDSLLVKKADTGTGAVLDGTVTIALERHRS